MANHSGNPARRQALIADTVALILFFTTTGTINKRFIAGMTWYQVFQARPTGAVLMVPVARPYGLRRDFLIRRANHTRLSQLLCDRLALVSFQVPIYVLIIASTGAAGAGLLWGILRASAMMLFLGRLYGAFPNQVRALFSLPPGGERPTSLNSGEPSER